MTTALQNRDAAKFLDLAAVAADLRRQGARWIVQDLNDGRHSSSLLLRATLIATRARADEIVQHIVTCAKQRDLHLLGQVLPPDPSEFDELHQTVAFMAIIDTVE